VSRPYRPEVTCGAAVHAVLRNAPRPLSVREIATDPGCSGWTHAAVWYAARRLVEDRVAVTTGCRSRKGGPKYQLAPIAFNPAPSA
jgi:hypothetical protein